MGPPLRAGRGRAGTSDPEMLAGRVRTRSPGSRAGPLPPAGPLQDTPRLAAGHLRARHVLPLRPAPRAPPGLGAVTGGPGRTRRALRLEDRAGERGAAGRSWRPGVWASVAPVSRSPRGAPRPGVGRAAESAPGGGREGPRGPSGARGGAGAGRRGKGLSPWEESGASGCARELSQRSGRPVGAQAPGPGVPGDGAGPPGGAVGGEASRSARLELELFESQLPPCHPRRREAVAYYPDIAVLLTSLKVTTFYFLFSLAFPWEKKIGIWPRWADAEAPNPHVYLSIPAGF